MSKWIDDQIVIDFPVPSSIRQIISELEKYDKEEDVYFYFDRSEWLENATKDYVYERVLTEEQRELLIQKYSEEVRMCKKLLILIHVKRQCGFMAVLPGAN